MLKDAKAISGFAVDDVPRAKDFYGTTLGLEVVDASLGVEGADTPAGLEIHLGPGTRVLVRPGRQHPVNDPGVIRHRGLGRDHSGQWAGR